MVKEINHHFVVNSQQSRTQPVASAQEQSKGAQHQQSKPVDVDVKTVEAQSPTRVDHGKLEKAVEDLNKYVQTVGRDLRFSVDRDSGQTIIRVMDRETEQMVRQIPPEEVVALAKFLHQTDDLSSTGLLEEA